MPEISNPNQHGSGGGNDSRTILMFTAVFIVILFGMQYFRKELPKSKPHEQTAAHSQAATPASAPAPPATTTTTTASNAAKSATAAPAAKQVAAVEAVSATTTVVENDLYRITFSNRGGEVTSWILKKYTDDHGKPLDLVNQAAAAKFGYPLSLYTSDAGLRETLANALYVPSATGALKAPASLSFNYSANGVTVKKTFTFDPKSYVIHADVTVTRNGEPVHAELAWPGGFGDQFQRTDYTNSNYGIESSVGGKRDSTEYKKVSNGELKNGPFDWAGAGDLYFAALFMPDHPADATLVTLRNTLAIPKNPAHPNPADVNHVDVIGAGIGNANGPVSTRLFVGPKSLDLLESIHSTSGPSLEAAVRFGMFSIVAKPLFILMQLIFSHVVPNWGWAILVLTLFINLAMLPTRFMMMKSSVKMQRIQPQMDAIKAKYAKYKATDPRKKDMQKEMFDLQKSEGVNMFGGCLPMLISYPLLYAFYEVLENAIELRHAHWLWLKDLSAPDPLYILPIAVVVSMFLMQYMTPSPGMDPKQQKMMAFAMPVFFGFFMLHYGAGLSLYWAGSNFISIAQQWVINRTKMGREMRELAQKRAAKKQAKLVHARR